MDQFRFGGCPTLMAQSTLLFASNNTGFGSLLQLEATHLMQYHDLGFGNLGWGWCSMVHAWQTYLQMWVSFCFGDTWVLFLSWYIFSLFMLLSTQVKHKLRKWWRLMFVLFKLKTGYQGAIPVPTAELPSLLLTECMVVWSLCTQRPSHHHSGWCLRLKQMLIIVF